MINKNRIFLGIVLVLFGLFIIGSSFQASNCHLDNKCLGMEAWFKLYDFDNVFSLLFFIILGIGTSASGGVLILKEINESEFTPQDVCEHEKKQWIPNGGNGYYRCKECKIDLKAHESEGDKE